MRDAVMKHKNFGDYHLKKASYHRSLDQKHQCLIKISLKALQQNFKEAEMKHQCLQDQRNKNFTDQ